MTSPGPLWAHVERFLAAFEAARVAFRASWNGTLNIAAGDSLALLPTGDRWRLQWRADKAEGVSSTRIGDERKAANAYRELTERPEIAWAKLELLERVQGGPWVYSFIGEYHRDIGGRELVRV